MPQRFTVAWTAFCIGEVASGAGVGVDTVRYYERVKLCPAPVVLRVTSVSLRRSQSSASDLSSKLTIDEIGTINVRFEQI